MKLFLVVCLSSVFTVAVFAIGEILDDVDVERFIKDETKIKGLFNCMLDREPCGEYQKYKERMPKIFETACSECAPKQKEKFDKGMKLATELYPKEMELIVKKYVLKSE